MKTRIKINITREQYQNLHGTNDNKKGDVVEDIVTKVLYEFGADEIYNVTDKNTQVNICDLYVQKDDKVINVEVKTSHTYRKQMLDKLAMDYKYKKKYTKGAEPYIQSTTNSVNGWIFITQANWLIVFNPDSLKLYIIKEYQKLKKEVLEHTEKYVNTLSKGEQTWYLRNNNNSIHKYLEGMVKEDSCKDSLGISLELSKRSLNYFECNSVIIDIDLQIDGENMIQYRRNEARRKREELEREKSPNFTGNKRRTIPRS